MVKRKISYQENEVIRILMDLLRDLEVDVHKIILFGSRAREDYTSGSDYDLLVIVKKPLSLGKKRRITSVIRMRMAKNDIPLDIFLKDLKEYETYKDIVGSLSYEVEREGIVV